LGYSILDSDISVFVKGDTFVAVYVDDLLIVGPRIDQINELKQSLSNRYKMTDLGPCNHYLGLTIRRDRANKAIYLGQRAYTERFLTAHNMWNNVNTKAIPMDPSLKLTPAQEGYKAGARFKTTYQSMVGSLMYAMLGTRPDIAFSVSVVSRYASNPDESHLRAVKNIFRYLRGTANYELCFQGTLESLTGFTDASWGDDFSTRRSTSGYIFNLGSGAITWSSKRQPTVALSTCEAELMGQMQACKEAVWLRRLLGELGEEQAQATVIFGDNIGALALAKNAASRHANTKHIPLQERWQHDLVEKDIVDLHWTPTNKMVADGLTKALPSPLFKQFTIMLGLKDSQF
jgi:hypothetical protein